MNLKILFGLLAALSMQSCTRSTADAAWQATMRSAVVGDWDEIRGTQEKLHFSSDGRLIMNSRSEHHSCTYDFPDAKHIRLDCLPAQVPHKPDVYGFSLANGRLMISDDLETGTYEKE